ncbi:ribonuclease J [Mycoplasma sp. SG1]|uniref:ribonuclease J n=1 Tax=Mycoplasma sp. SG1 TaxID=2810348 RepID=UPI00202502A0|nr:ribonuclease J [Mycoplasma sp. SG1]URM53218.1 ribonuclease J [Mycoplasma sp. SG1]
MITNSNKLKIYALGGFTEIAKNCFFIEYNNEIVIFNYGNYPSPNNNLGINIKISNIKYLLKKANHIKAIFFTNMSENNIGGYRYFFSKFKTPIYASKLTIDWLKGHDVNNQIFKNINFHQIESNKTINFNYFKITPFNLDTNMFDSYNYLIDFDNWKIFYLNDYFLNFEATSLKPLKMLTNLEFLYQNSKPITEKQSLVISSSSGYVNKQFACFNSSIREFIANIFNNHINQKIFISVYNYDFLVIKEIIHLAITKKRSLFFANNKLFQFLKFLEKNNFFSFEHLKIISNHNELDENSIILLSGKNPQILKDILLLLYSPKILQITKSDVFVSLTRPLVGFELLGVEIYNEFIKQDITFYFLPKTCSTVYPSRYDILTVLKYINPDYFVPVSLHYNLAVETVKRINSQNYPFKGLLVENGDCIVFDKNSAVVLEKQIDVDSLFLQSFQQKEITDNILTDRITLLNDGLLATSLGINFEKNQIVTNIDFQTKGIDLDILPQSKEKIKELIKTNVNGALIQIKDNIPETDKLKILLESRNQLTKLIQKFIFTNFKKSPIIEVNFFII